MIFLSLLFVLSAQAATQKITLEGAIEHAVREATLVMKQENNRELAGANLLQAYGNFLPDLTATAGYSWDRSRTLQVINGVALLDSSYHGVDYRISSTLNLFHGFSDSGNLAAAIHRRSAAGLTLERARQQIALDVAENYLQVVLDQQLKDIAAKNLDVSKDRLKLFQAQRAVGALAPADEYRQAAQVASDQSSFVSAKNRVNVDKLILVQRLRLNARDTYVLADPPLPAPSASKALPAEKDLIDSALRDRRDYHAQNENTSAADSDIVVAQSGYWPVVDLQGAFDGSARNYGRLSLDGAPKLPPFQNSLADQLGRQDEASLSFLLTWNIFSRFTTTRDVVQARTTADNAHIDRDDYENQVVIDVKQGLLDLQTAFDQLEATTAGVAASQKAFELLSGRYKVGASSFLDLNTAQAVLVQSQASRAEALVNYNLREKALNFALGRDI